MSNFLTHLDKHYRVKLGTIPMGPLMTLSEAMQEAQRLVDEELPIEEGGQYVSVIQEVLVVILQKGLDRGGGSS